MGSTPVTLDYLAREFETLAGRWRLDLFFSVHKATLYLPQHASPKMIARLLRGAADMIEQLGANK